MSDREENPDMGKAELFRALGGALSLVSAVEAIIADYPEVGALLVGLPRLKRDLETALNDMNLGLR